MRELKTLWMGCMVDNSLFVAARGGGVLVWDGMVCYGMVWDSKG